MRIKRAATVAPRPSRRIRTRFVWAPRIVSSGLRLVELLLLLLLFLLLLLAVVFDYYYRYQPHGVLSSLTFQLLPPPPLLFPVDSSNGTTFPPVGPSAQRQVRWTRRSSPRDEKYDSLFTRNQPSSNHYYNESSLNKLLYTGYFGMGHRLSKLSAAVQLATRLDLPLVQVQWGVCATGERIDNNDVTVDIFAHLFGSNQIQLRQPQPHDYAHKVVWVRNDVAGYAAAQSYKNNAVPVSYPRAVVAFTNQLDAELALWTDLWYHRWTGRATVTDFQRHTQWHGSTSRLVIGVHVRAGNGEQDHFVAAKRGLRVPVVSSTNSTSSSNTTMEEIQVAVTHMAHLIRQLIQDIIGEGRSKQSTVEPLIFVAADTVQYIDALRVALDPFTVVSYEAQPRVAFGQGVSYQAWSTTTNASSQCLSGWSAAAVDMALLAETDILIATSRSTFSQIVPASLVFHRSTKATKWRFCEMDLFATRSENSNGNNQPVKGSMSRMTCFQSQHAWLFREPVEAWHTFCTTESGDNTTCNDPMREAVAHKVMVHLPEIGSMTSRDTKLYTSARDFLQQSTPAHLNETVFYYGRKFDAKYRRKMAFRSEWTWKIE